jgi:pyruvate formate-lyase activating enzyme-like uncharacterized protein
MKAIGVDHLNLHQLRLNPFNRDQLDKRKYTYLHGDKVTVLEYELMALALMEHVVDQNIGLPVNYCASVFQHRFQRAAVRRKSARLKGFTIIFMALLAIHCRSQLITLALTSGGSRNILLAKADTPNVLRRMPWKKRPGHI